MIDWPNLIVGIGIGFFVALYGKIILWWIFAHTIGLLLSGPQ